MANETATYLAEVLSECEQFGTRRQFWRESMTGQLAIIAALERGEISQGIAMKTLNVDYPTLNEMRQHVTAIGKALVADTQCRIAAGARQGVQR